MASLFSIKKTRAKTTVRIIDAPSETTTPGPNRRVCVVCRQVTSKYECPTCLVPYCSSKCFKDHGIRCTEGFYRRHVTRILDLDGGDRAQSLGFLKADRPGAKESASAAEEVDCAPYGVVDLSFERLEELSSCAENLTLEDLSEEEKRVFLRSVARGDLTPQMWLPWWLEAKPVISDLSDPMPEDNVDDSRSRAELEAIYSEVKASPDFTSISPAICVQHSGRV